MDSGLWETHPNNLSSSTPVKQKEDEDNSEDKVMSDEASWKEERYGQLLKAMLNLEQPKITENMAEMLAKPDVSKRLADFLTLAHETPDSNKLDVDSELQLAAGSRFKRKRITGRDDRMRLSYQVMCVLTGMDSEIVTTENDDQVPEPVIDKEILLTLLSKISPIIVPPLFEAFHPDSNASLYHVCPVLATILACQGESLYGFLNQSNHSVKKHMEAMLNYVHIDDVSALLIDIVCPNSARAPKPVQVATEHVKTYTNETLWKFYKKLANWKFLSVVSEHVRNPQAPAFHRTAAAEFFNKLVMKLAADHTGGGEMLLQPLGHCPEIVQALVEVSCLQTRDVQEAQVRDATLDTLMSITQLSTELVVQAEQKSDQPYAGFANGLLNQVQNQMVSVKEHLHDLIESHFVEICNALNNTAHSQRRDLEQGLPPIKHAGYVVDVPFTYYRLLLVKLLRVCLCTRPEKLFDELPRETCRFLCVWLLQYPFASLYHNEFLEIFSCALKFKHADHEIIKVLLQKNKLISVLIEYYLDESKKGDVKGHILRMMNMIRLMASSLSPSHHFLPQFLKSHAAWRSYQPRLLEDTYKLAEPWDESIAASLRIVHHAKSTDTMSYVSMLPGGNNPLATNMELSGDELLELGIDLGSKFANELGFEGYVQFSGSEKASPSYANTAKKKKKKKKRKRKKVQQQNMNENINNEDEESRSRQGKNNPDNADEESDSDSNENENNKSGSENENENQEVEDDDLD